MIEALETKHFVSAAGEYLGGYGGVRRTTETPNPREVVVKDPETGKESRTVKYDPPTITVTEEWPPVPAGAVEVPLPPASPLDRWNGTAWAPPAAAVVAAAKTKLATDLINGTPAIVALVEALAARLSITPSTLLADVVARLAVK